MKTRFYALMLAYLSRVNEVRVQKRFDSFSLEFNLLVNLPPCHLRLSLVLTRHSSTIREPPLEHHTPFRPQLRYLGYYKRHSVVATIRLQDRQIETALKTSVLSKYSGWNVSLRRINAF